MHVANHTLVQMGKTADAYSKDHVHIAEDTDEHAVGDKVGRTAVVEGLRFAWLKLFRTWRFPLGPSSLKGDALSSS